MDEARVTYNTKNYDLPRRVKSLAVSKRCTHLSANPTKLTNLFKYMTLHPTHIHSEILEGRNWDNVKGEAGQLGDN